MKMKVASKINSKIDKVLNKFIIYAFVIKGINLNRFVFINHQLVILPKNIFQIIYTTIHSIELPVQSYEWEQNWMWCEVNWKVTGETR